MTFNHIRATLEFVAGRERAGQRRVAPQSGARRSPRQTASMRRSLLAVGLTTLLTGLGLRSVRRRRL